MESWQVFGLFRFEIWPVFDFVGRLGNLKTLAGLSCSVDLCFCQWFFKKNNLLQ